MPSKEDIVELKAMVALAKKGPINIGFCLGKKPATAVVVMDRKRAPEILAREAKAAGETAKTVGGIIQIDGTDATIRCEIKPPGDLAKQVKGFFAAIGVKLTVAVVMPDGKPAPQDADDPPEAGAGPEARAKSEPEPEAESEVEPEVAPEESARPDAKTVALRLKALQPRVAEAQGGPAATLRALLGKAVELLQGGAVDKANMAAAKLEEALDKGAGAAPASAPAPAPAAPHPVIEKLTGMVSALPQGTTRAAMTALLETESANLAKGKTDTLKATAQKLQEGLALQAAIDKLAPQVAEAASKGLVADVRAMTLLFNHVVENVPAPDQAKALAVLDRIRQMLAAGGQDADRQVAPDVKPFAVSRIDWGKSRSRMMEELGKLQAAIEAQCRAVGGLEEVIASLPDLLEPLASIDQRLEDKLDAIVGSAPGAARDKLKSEARGLIKTYQDELTKPFFQEVDAANGFANVAVTATARAALSRVESVLAA